MDEKRKVALEYAVSWIGRPYIWAGDDFSGFDCSGFVIEVLKSVGILPHNFDDTAHGLYIRFLGYAVPRNRIETGCLAFWTRDNRAYHVEFCVNGWQTVGASGGKAPSKTPEEVVDENAFINAILPDATLNLNPFLRFLIQRGIYLKDAIDRDAYIKRRPVNYRGESYTILDPFAAIGGN